MNGRSLSPAAQARFQSACHHYQSADYGEAERGFRAVLDEAPGFGQALGNLAETLRALGRFDESLAVFAVALRASPDDATIHNNHGATLRSAGQLTAAIAAFRRATELAPEMYRAQANLGHALAHASQPALAIAPLERAVQLNGSEIANYLALGAAYFHVDRAPDAAALLVRALRLDARSYDVRFMLAGALWGSGRLEDAVQQYREAQSVFAAHGAVSSSMLLALHHGDGVGPAELFDEHLRFGAALHRAEGAPASAWPNDRSPARRLRVGYVSPDFRRHPVGFFVTPVLEAHDREAFELFAYGDERAHDDVQARVRAAVDHFVDVTGWSDERLAARVAADQIDVLVDLAGHTVGAHLGVFARRPAPVSLTWLGYPDTTGLATIDYRVTDAVADPPGADAHYTEDLLRLPRCFVAYARPRGVEPVDAPPSRASGRIAFGAFNAPYKLSSRLARAWAAVLDGVPGSRLLLKARAFAHPAVRARALGLLAAAGVAPERIEFLAYAPAWEDALAHYNQVDIALDSFPYNGTTTTCDALSMGVPLVALRGASHAARVSASVLTALGEPSLIAESEADYVRVAVALARDPARLAQLRRELPGRFDASPVGSPARLARDLEDAYRTVWTRYCEAGARPPRTLAPAVLRDDECDHVPIAGGVTVAVPRAFENLTSYVLREQGDWFEDEMGFIRALTQPGDRAIDCGANHGVYALTLGRLAGPAGRVWAFEPAQRTAAFLRMGVARNGLANVTVFEAALSQHSGQATLHLGAGSELSSLVEDARVAGVAAATETVAVFSLDDVAARDDIRGVTFCKLDAEGEEQRIVEGGLRFFADESPLVMTEFRHAGIVNTGLVEAFTAQGYAPYRLVPGLGVLAPFSELGAPDAYFLNVFFCKPDRAAALAARGLLVRPEDAAAAPVADGAWRAALSPVPYAQGLWPQGLPSSSAPGAASHMRALDAWFASRDASRSPAARVAALVAALEASAQSLEAHAATGRLFTAVRIARAAGKRAAAVALLDEALRRFRAGQTLALDEAFLAPCDRFDDVPVTGGAADWGLAATLEAHERLRAWSSCFTGYASLDALDTLARIGYLGPEMAQRRAVLRARFAV